MQEFDMIARYFAPLSRDGLKDDAAVVEIPEGYELVITSDTLNEGTHFWAGEDPEYIARKALAVNVSDLCAMGARPLCYQLCLAFPDAPAENWVRDFAAALLQDQTRYGMFCSGGDTTTIKGGVLSVSLTALGLVPRGKAVKRSGAKGGDVIVLSGPIGDAVIGLHILQGRVTVQNAAPFLSAYRAPQTAYGQDETLRANVHAAIDISDGFIADLGHICRASDLAAVVEVDKIPFSPEAKEVLAAGVITLETLLTGGDDYRLILAVPPENIGALGEGYEVIGVFKAGAPEVSVLDSQQNPLSFTQKGWTHF